MILTISSWKGGTGKTTLGVLIAETLANRGKKVLIIDLDSNCAISNVYNSIDKDFTSKNLLSNTGSFAVYNVKENIDIIPSDLQNVLLNNIMDTQLKIAIKKHDLASRYDFILIDPPGYWGSHTRNAVMASDCLIIPATCSNIDYNATALYFKTLAECCIDVDTFLAINKFNKKLNLQNSFDKYHSDFGEYLLPNYIPEILSLKKITSGEPYTLHASVQKRMNVFIDHFMEVCNA
ncbi:MAG: ParA family protein [Treponemataceae bacterium]